MSGNTRSGSKSSSHGFFRFITVLNLIADIYMCAASGIKSRETAVLIGMIMLSACFFALIVGTAFSSINMKRSSCAILGAGYLFVNLIIGFIFACELYIHPDGDFLRYAETAGVILIIILILVTVNVLVRRKVENRL